MDDSERVEAKHEIVRQRLAIVRHLEARHWPWDRQASLWLDTLLTMTTSTEET
ncbi:hypothetical protein MYX04_13995 [Nitrospiraceae bacterium AH_259_D15_M11_P09]|nr:hypothetical protein [Nitrospiraceae bacterium AH_259_D15_M11_P09]